MGCAFGIHGPRASGSAPVAAKCGVVSFVLDWGSKAHYPRKYAGVAQLEEQSPCKREVVGSKPISGTKPKGREAYRKHPTDPERGQTIIGGRDVDTGDAQLADAARRDELRREMDQFDPK